MFFSRFSCGFINDALNFQSCCAPARWWRRLAGEALISSEQQQWEFTKAGRFEMFSKHSASQKLGMEARSPKLTRGLARGNSSYYRKPFFGAFSDFSNLGVEARSPSEPRNQGGKPEAGKRRVEESLRQMELENSSRFDLLVLSKDRYLSNVLHDQLKHFYREMIS